MKTWTSRCRELQAFRRRQGHVAVPRDWRENPGLARWVAVQRARFSALSPRQLKRLLDLGFDFGPWDTRWIRRFLELVAYGKRHGHCHVPCGWLRNRSLANWVALQRKTLPQLSPARRRLLARLPIQGTLRDVTFDKRLAELRSFRAQHGHCRVPTTWPRNPRLSRWVRRQRERKERLSPEKKRRLDALGFVWNRFEWQWEESFHQLLAFRKRYGHCRVPSHWAPQPSLGHWVSRLKRDRARLPRQQVRRLNALGFAWKAFFLMLTIGPIFRFCIHGVVSFLV